MLYDEMCMQKRRARIESSSRSYKILICDWLTENYDKCSHHPFEYFNEPSPSDEMWMWCKFRKFLNINWHHQTHHQFPFESPTKASMMLIDLWHFFDSLHACGCRCTIISKFISAFSCLHSPFWCFDPTHSKRTFDATSTHDDSSEIFLPKLANNKWFHTEIEWKMRHTMEETNVISFIFPTKLTLSLSFYVNILWKWKHKKIILSTSSNEEC